MVPHTYKSYKVYRVIVLNFLVRALNINIYQKNLEEKLDKILEKSNYKITKSDIRHEIRSNHKMTEKVLKELKDEELINIIEEDKRSYVRITKKGVLHLRKWNRFYINLYREQIVDHYRYTGVPPWFTEENHGGGI